MGENQFEHLFGEFHTRSIGYNCDTDRHCISYVQNHKFRMIRFSVLSTPDKFPEFIRIFSVDEVLIALSLRSYDQPAAQIIAQCEEQGIPVCMLRDLFSPKLAKSAINQVGGDPTLTLNTGAIGDQAILIKRLIDLLMALPSITLLLSFFTIIAVMITLTSPGPVFFIQERVGFN